MGLTGRVRRYRCHRREIWQDSLGISLSSLHVIGVGNLSIGASVDVRGVGLRVLVGGNCPDSKRSRLVHQGQEAGSDAENLSRVNGETALIDTGVVVRYH